jgi:uncharacterized protein (TIGR02996 family)
MATEVIDLEQTCRDSGGLMQALLLSPNDESPRLVFADWLDDRNISYFADFIRLQIQDKDRYKFGPITIWDQEVSVVFDLDREISFDFPEYMEGMSVRLMRGFVEELQCRSEDWFAYSHSMKSFLPIKCVLLEFPPKMREGEKLRLMDEFQRAWPRVRFDRTCRLI